MLRPTLPSARASIFTASLLAALSCSTAQAAPQAAGQASGEPTAAVETVSLEDVTSAAAGAQSSGGFTIEPFQVGDETISVAEIKRAMVYTVGSRLLEARKMDVFISQEIERQVAAGADRSAFALDSGAVDQVIEDAEAQIKEQYPEQNVADVLAMTALSPSQWRSQLEQTQLFDQVFLPSDPDKWPDTTIAALEGGGRGVEFREKLAESFRNRAGAQDPEATGPEPAAPAGGEVMLKMILRQLVVGALQENAEILKASDGLDPEYVMQVNGVGLRTDDVYASLEAELTPEKYERARRWIAKTTAVRQELQKSGNWLSDEEWKTVFEEHQAPFAGSPISLDVLVLSFKRFPSMESYKTYFRLLKSYEASIAAELTDENLTSHLERASLLMGLSKVDVELILCSAYDFARNEWKENGWQIAEENAVAAAKALSEGEDWNSVLESYSGFWDPPRPADPAMQQQQQQQQRLNQGRFGFCNRNELLQKLRENDFTMFLDGPSIGDAIFFDQEVGTTEGPFQGLYGYYFSRVKSRTPPTQRMSLDVENQRDLVVQDYVQVRFNDWSDEVANAN